MGAPPFSNPDELVTGRYLIHNIIIISAIILDPRLSLQTIMANNHHEYEEVHLADDDDHDEDIELVSGGRRQRRTTTVPPPPASSSSTAGRGSSSSSSSSTTRWIFILFVIVLIGVYKLGMEEGKAEVVKHEGGGGGENNNYSNSNVIEQAKQNNNDQATAPDITTTTTTTSPPPKPPMKFTINQLQSTRTECHNLINLLDNYYYGKDKAIPMLMNSYIDPWDFDEIVLVNDHDDDDDHDNSNNDNFFIESTDETVVHTSSPRKLRGMKLVNTMLRALVTDSQDTFLMGGIGSSVMAGHDNW